MTIKTDEIRDQAGTGPVSLYLQTASRLLCKMTNAAVVDSSLNVSSSVDNGTADWTINFTNDFDDVDTVYSLSFYGALQGDKDLSVTGTLSVSSATIESQNNSGTNSETGTGSYTTGFGDLA